MLPDDTQERLSAALNALRPLTAAIARDAPPREQYARVLDLACDVAGGRRAVLLVRPARVAIVLGAQPRDNEPVQLGPRAAIVVGGPLAGVIEAHESSVGPTFVADGRYVVVAARTGGLLVEAPAADLVGDEGRLGLLQVLTDLASGVTHTARRMVEAHQRTVALEGARRRLGDQNALLQDLARSDELTGLANRRVLRERLEQELDRFQRYGRPVALVLCDVDHFKQVNDRFGHPVGDRVLQAVAQRALEATRKVDLVARYGGEEIVMVMPETHAAGALTVAERMRKAVAQTSVQADAAEVRVTISCGVAATYDGWVPDADELVRAADAALYRAKAEGRNRVIVGRPASPKA